MVLTLGVADLIGGAFIFLFALLGLYGFATNYQGHNVIMNVATSLDIPLLLNSNVLMLTSAGSTMDSTFTSTAKLTAKDWKEKQDNTNAMKLGRNGMNFIALLGNLPLLSIYLDGDIGPAIIKATTISATMVMGLAPIFLLSFLLAQKLSFHMLSGLDSF